MYNSKSILALITARGGSKGIPRKNIKLLGGMPLINWTINAAKRSKHIDRLIISSDDMEIIDVARRAGCEVPFVRPTELAQDTTSSMDVILHAIDSIEGTYDYLLLLQPTSPFRTSDHIDQIIESCIGSGSNVMVSVSKLKKHPLFMYELVDGFLKPVLESIPQQRRQDMPNAYEHNGALYISRTDYLRRFKSYNTSDVRGFQMADYTDVDIDEPADWEYAEYLIQKKVVK